MLAGLTDGLLHLENLARCLVCNAFQQIGFGRRLHTEMLQQFACTFLGLFPARE